jgi:hypothetical protein
MPFWLPGRTRCGHCGEALRSGDDVVSLPPAWLPAYEPMYNFREAWFHRDCWAAWPHRERFIERVNDTDSGYRIEGDGRWEFVGQRRS